MTLNYAKLVMIVQHNHINYANSDAVRYNAKLYRE